MWTMQAPNSSGNPIREGKGICASKLFRNLSGIRSVMGVRKTPGAIVLQRIPRAPRAPRAQKVLRARRVPRAPRVPRVPRSPASRLLEARRTRMTRLLEARQRLQRLAQKERVHRQEAHPLARARREATPHQQAHAAARMTPHHAQRMHNVAAEAASITFALRSRTSIQRLTPPPRPLETET